MQRPEIAALALITSLSLSVAMAGEEAPAAPAVADAQGAVDAQVVTPMNAQQDLRFSFSRARVITEPVRAELMASAAVEDAAGRAFFPFKINRASAPEILVATGCYYPDVKVSYLQERSTGAFLRAGSHPLLGGEAPEGGGEAGRCVPREQAGAAPSS